MKAVDVENTLNIVTSYNINDNSENAADKVSDKMFGGLQNFTRILIKKSSSRNIPRMRYT